jgi:hypothetical protein
LKKKADARTNFIRDDLPKHLANLEKLIGLYGQNGFSVGDSLTWADIFIFEFVFASHVKDSETEADFSAKYPKLNGVYELVRLHPKLATYFETRPVTAF